MLKKSCGSYGTFFADGVKQVHAGLLERHELEVVLLWLKLKQVS